MPKKNCWVLKNCGREPGGRNCQELGVCPAATMSQFDNVHDGKNGGRVCWAISGTLCKGEKQGTFAMKMSDCMKCDFYQKVKSEEGAGFKYTKDLLDMM